MGDNINLENFSEKIKCNKNYALTGVLIALLLSCATIVVGLIKYNPDKPIIDKTVVTKELNEKPFCKTTCCKLLHNVESASFKITETNYDNSANLLLYASILVFMFLSLWGTFTVLLKVLKSESEINSKIIDVEKEIYKEKQMWELAKLKNEHELEENKKIREHNDAEIEYKKKEIGLRKEEFDSIEKVKLEMKYDHELKLKGKEN